MDPQEQDNLLTALETDHRQATLSAADRAIIDYAERLTSTPAQMTQADVQNLRAVGLDDRAIHDVCTIAAYFNFVNRVADGLGVELETKS